MFKVMECDRYTSDITSTWTAAALYGPNYCIHKLDVDTDMDSGFVFPGLS